MEMAKLHIDQEFMFGPVVVSHLPDDYDRLSEEEKVKAQRRVTDAKDMITKGQKRVMEKVKEIRQFLESCNFWNQKCWWINCPRILRKLEQAVGWFCRYRTPSLWRRRRRFGGGP